MFVRYKALMAILLLLSLSGTGFADASGDNLFARHCMICHKNINTISSSAARIRIALSPGTVSKHRFILSESEKEELVKYLTKDSQQ